MHKQKKAFMQTLVAPLCMLLHLKFITRVGIRLLMTSSSTFQVLVTLKSLCFLYRFSHVHKPAQLSATEKCPQLIFIPI